MASEKRSERGIRIAIDRGGTVSKLTYVQRSLNIYSNLLTVLP